MPIECIDIADWLFNLPEAEYQRSLIADAQIHRYWGDYAL
jgi:hypothetical protein